jgi:uncharacterized membrane protein
MTSDRIKIDWRWGVIASVAMAVLALYPQLHFWVVSGDWNMETYAHMEGVGDEVAYSAYINALIEGRPRRNDPYTGRDDQHGSPQPESLFSIQFVPAYMIALPARALGLKASSAFIALMLISAIGSSLAIFWLIASVTGDNRLAAASTILVLCLGTLIGGHGHVSSLLGFKPLYNYLIFLRRYQPSATFPLFFVFCALVWRALACTGKRSVLILTLAAGITFGLLVFSYFYLWTAAAAWTACLALLWVVIRPERWRSGVISLGLTCVLSIAAVVPYLILLRNRAMTMDSVQAMTISHRPDLLRLPELIAYAVVAALLYCARRGTISLQHRAVLFSLSFALMPVAVFNQQVLTGRSLQPVHYEMFVANYSVLVSIVIAAAMIWRGRRGTEYRFPKKALAWIAIIAFEWGAYETFVAATGSVELNRRLADAQPVAVRLAEIGRSEGIKTPRPVVLSTDLLVADGLPTSAPQAVLWAPHMPVFSGVTNVESKERFYQYLYYTGIDAEELRGILTKEGRYGFAAAIFGFERAVEGLSDDSGTITAEELENELRLYSAYRAAFSRERARLVELSYVVVPNETEPDLSNLDRWYERDAGVRAGKFTLYRVRPRENPNIND